MTPAEHGTRNTEHGARAGFKQLRAWQAADDFASLVFRAVRDLPPRESWFANQFVRSAVSVPANIAEGYGRGSLADYLRFLDIARGSLAEAEYYIHFARRQSLFKPEILESLEAAHVAAGNLLFRLWQALKQKSTKTWDHGTGTIREESNLYVVE